MRKLTLFGFNDGNKLAINFEYPIEKDMLETQLPEDEQIKKMAGLWKDLRAIKRDDNRYLFNLKKK